MTADIPPSPPLWVACICGIVSACIGGLGLVGWMLDSRVLTGVRMEYIPIAPNTALIIILLGIALVSVTRWPGHRKVRLAIAGLVSFCILLAGLTLASRMTGLDLKMDDLFISTSGIPGSGPVGLMSPVTATCFLLGCAAILLLLKKRNDPAAILSTAITLTAGLILIGYWYGAPLLYGGSFIPVALPTAVALGILGTGLIAAAGPASWPLSGISGGSTRAKLLRGLLPVIILIILIVNWITVFILGAASSTVVLAAAVMVIVSLLVVYLVVSYLSREIGDTIDNAERERKRANEALQLKATDLEAAFEEITATEEELRANYEELATIQRSLKENERKYRNLYTYAQVGLFETSFRDGTVVTCNERYALLAGYSSVEEAIGSVILPHYVNPEDRTEVGRILREQGHIDNYVLKLRNHSTGKIFWTQFSARFDDEREVAEGSIIDITAQKEAEAALKESEEKFRALFARMIEGSALHEMIYDPLGTPVDYRILDVNPAYERIIGLRGEEVIGKTSREAYHGEIPPFLEIYARVAATGQPEVFEVFFAPMEKHFSISVSSPQHGRFATIFEDITERKQTEQQHEAMIKELEQKNAELERFTYTVSHDLKSPLITIKGFAGLLESDTQSGDREQLKRDILRISTAADTMQASLNDLLELSRVGRVISPPSRTAFDTIAKEALELLAGPLAERGVAVEIAPDLPVVNVDRARIREVLVNLIENAVKFMGDEPHPHIRISAETGGEMPVLSVRDNGIGINPKYLNRIFNLFEKLTPSMPGTGIGLPIVRRIIEVHGGKIWAESEGPGKGTTIRFTLPAAHDNPEEPD